MKQKNGAIELSFGMIFSVVLIIVFLAFGFYAITKFIDLQKTIQIEKFLSDLQSDVDKMWKSSQGSQTVEYMLPSNVVSVCFKDDEFENLQFSSNNIIRGKMIQHIDIEKTIGSDDSLCFQNADGKVSMTLVKNFGEVLVTVTE
ncbi:MAG: hypothetical protein PHQ66_03475 [Candidatus Nanoarchaeia archaeon]|nr:hypothetical protein [Candidatus Nanoarchaeia archaeon]MDD5357577.1 hypothetical protein [Candidatus Nanoarchaeia archaeon]MDD5588496.1 hypothetical protein [Candidatus Nanoarchaeia archaeon]